MNEKNKPLNLKKIALHLIGCLLFLSIPIVFSPDLTNKNFSFWQISGFKRNFVQFLWTVIVFYVNYFLLVPYIFLKNKKKIYYLSVFILLIVSILLNRIPFIQQDNIKFNKAVFEDRDKNFGHKPQMEPDMMHPNPDFQNPGFPKPENNRFPPNRFNKNPFFSKFQWALDHNINLTVLPLLAILFGTYLRRNQQLIEIQNEKLKSEVAYLKAQINPHFLFNSLNSIYALALDKSDLAPEAIIKLSEIMRYVVSESEKDFVELKKEINYIKNFIELQRLRLPESQQIDLLIDIENENQFIAPLILIPYIENAFKYGINANVENLISIVLKEENNILTLIVVNNKYNNNSGLEESKQGQKNTKKRLDILYPNQYNLTIFDEELSYEVRLKIDL